MSNDTASIPGEDLRDFGLDLPPMVTGLLVVWASEEMSRLGEVFLFDSTRGNYTGRSATGYCRGHRVHASQPRGPTEDDFGGRPRSTWTCT